MKLMFQFNVQNAKDCYKCIFFVQDPTNKATRGILWGNQPNDLGRCTSADANQKRVNDFTEKYWGCIWHISMGKKL